VRLCKTYGREGEGEGGREGRTGEDLIRSSSIIAQPAAKDHDSVR